jgi:hypothetical protein
MISKSIRRHMLTGREHLVEGNAALQNNYSVAAVAGTALSGYFVQ